MRPDHSRRSVPVLMPLHSMSHDDVLVAGGGQREAAEREVLGRLEDDGEGICTTSTGVRLPEPADAADCQSTVSVYADISMSSLT